MHCQTIQMINEFKLTVVHVHAQTRRRSVHERGFTTGQKTVENPGLGSGPPGQAFGLAGRSRALGCGPRVCILIIIIIIITLFNEGRH